MEGLIVRRLDKFVLLVKQPESDGQTVGLGYRLALDLYAAAKKLWQAEERFLHQASAAPYERISVDAITLELTGLRVQWLYRGSRWFDCPSHNARQILRAVYAKAKEIEQYVEIETTITDQALLLKSGAGLLLHNDPRVLQEAAKQLPGAGGVDSASLVGLPALKHLAPAS